MQLDAMRLINTSGNIFFILFFSPPNPLAPCYVCLSTCFFLLPPAIESTRANCTAPHIKLLPALPLEHFLKGVDGSSNVRIPPVLSCNRSTLTARNLQAPRFVAETQRNRVRRGFAATDAAASNSASFMGTAAVAAVRMSIQAHCSQSVFFGVGCCSFETKKSL
jgi:hypothetical protein